MKALSIRQPWAWLIAHGHKHFENRDWSPRNWCRTFRGPFLIHASQGMTHDEYLCAVSIAADHGVEIPPESELQRGGIIGQAEVISWHDEAPNMPFAFTSGLLIVNAKPMDFQPCKGSLGFFTPKI